VSLVGWPDLLYNPRRFPPRFVGPHFIFDAALLARRGRTTVVRILYAAILLLFLFLYASDWIHWRNFLSGQLTIARAAKLANALAVLILIVQAGAALVLTPAYMAGAIALEKERQTILALLTTRLSSAEIVMGKLFGRLVHVGSVGLTALPVIFLIALWGGVDLYMVVGSFVATGLAMLSAGSICMLCSIIARQHFTAVIMCYAAVAALLSAWMFSDVASPFHYYRDYEARTTLAWQTWRTPKLAPAPPLTLRVKAMPAPLLPVGPPPNQALICLRSLRNHVVVHGFLFLSATIASVLTLRPSCLRQAEAAVRRSLVRSSREFWPERYRSPAWMRSMLPHWGVGESLLLPREIYQGAVPFAHPRVPVRLLTVSETIFYLGMAPVSFFVFKRFPSGWTGGVEVLNEFARILTAALLTVWCLLTAMRAIAAFGRERDQQTLELLLVVPGGHAEVFKAKWLGSMLRYDVLGYGLGFIIFIAALVGVLNPIGALLLAMYSTTLVILAASLGSWLALTCRNRQVANLVMASIFFLTALPATIRVFFQSSHRHEIFRFGWVEALAELIDPAAIFWELTRSMPNLLQALSTDRHSSLLRMTGSAWIIGAYALLTYILMRLGRRQLHRV
jgi:ABC-type transport system involved in multi-copper enzyme maturation permease subunit